MGQTFMLDTMHCLQTALVPLLEDEVKDCDAIRRFAISSHAQCYLESGWCKLEMQDWLTVLHIIGLKKLFESWNALETGLKTLSGCLSFPFISLVHKS